MQTKEVKLYSLDYADLKTYTLAAAFIAGNIILPQLCHLVHLGGPTWLPIYLFTLIGAYKYGWRTGLLTGIFSPVINSVLFGMPAPAVLPAILFKSVLLAVFAGLAASRFKKVTLWLTASVVLAYQVVGTLGEWLLSGSFTVATQDFRIGIPGMLVQIFGGYFVIKYLIRK